MRAHKPARITYAMITTGRPCEEIGAFKLTQSSRAKPLQNLQNQAHALGMQFVAA